MKFSAHDALRLLESNNLPASARLKTELKALDRPAHVAVIGEFKVGKSTLINKVFLREHVLFTDVLEATAVPTAIVRGARKELAVTKYIQERSAVSVGENSKETEVATGTQPPILFNDPTLEDIKANTAGDTPDERSHLAKTVAEARLTWPAEHLGNVTVIDTPGINSPNQAVMATTYRVIPEADVAVFLKTAKQLTEIERSFLTSRVFNEGVGRVLMLVAYDPAFLRLSEEKRLQLTEAIKAQLAAMGRGHVPVAMICLNFDTAESGLPLSNAESIHHYILQFVEENAQRGRAERVAHVARRDLQNALLQVAAEESALNVSVAERRAMLEQVAKEEARIQKEKRGLADELAIDLDALRKNTVRDMEEGLNRAGDKYVAGFDQCQNLSAVQSRLQSASSLLQPDVERAIGDATAKMRRVYQELMKRQSGRAQELAEQWRQNMAVELRIDGGFFANVPPLLVLAGDLLLTVEILPEGVMIDLILRYVGGQIPIIKDIFPSRIIQNVLMNQIKESVREQLTLARNDLGARLGKMLDEVSARIRQELEAEMTSEVEAVRHGLEQSISQPADPKRVTDLCSLKKELEAGSAALNASQN